MGWRTVAGAGVWPTAFALCCAAALPALAEDKPAPATPPPAAPADAPAAAPAAVPAPAGAPPPAAAAAPAKPPSQDTAGTPATVIDESQIETVLGRSVLSPTGEDMGRIVDVLVDQTGTVRAAVIDFGGFFGVGSRKIAVDWGSLHFKSNGKTDTVVADLPRNQLKMAPVYKETEPVVVIGRASGAEVKAKEPPPGAPTVPEPAPK